MKRVVISMKKSQWYKELLSFLGVLALHVFFVLFFVGMMYYMVNDCNNHNVNFFEQSIKNMRGEEL